MVTGLVSQSVLSGASRGIAATTIGVGPLAVGATLATVEASVLATDGRGIPVDAPADVTGDADDAGLPEQATARTEITAIEMPRTPAARG